VAEPASVQAVIYREGNGWVAQCLNVDVASEGDTEDDARANFLEALELYFDEPRDRLGVPEVEQPHVEEPHVEELRLKSA
jgi:predicted RNase H-like HicB family nuclease